MAGRYGLPTNKTFCKFLRTILKIHFFFYFNHTRVCTNHFKFQHHSILCFSIHKNNTIFFSLPTLTFVHNNHQLSTLKPLLMKVVRSKRVEGQNAYLQKHITIHTKIRLPVYFNSKVYFRLYDV